MSSIKLKHSGGNSVSLNPPSSAPTSSDVAFKLPNADGSAGQVIKTDASGNLGWAISGKVKQYKYVQSSTLAETTSSSYQDPSFSVAITPTSASNLLLATYTIQANVYEQSGNDAMGLIALTDDGASSYLYESELRFYDYGGSGGFINAPVSVNHVKVAGSTSARTYSIRYRVVAGDKIVINNYGTGSATRNSFLSVMEIEP